MASEDVKKAINLAAANYVKPEGKVFEYGTAGVSC
jgi:phosphoacetylglucosamine mutase